ncbi:hypothetical protein LG272_10505 [Pseudidiomarina marina]|uniref:hypothetical protein n=1 Tax=Pseudidiomarina marina TaxID=502366 RepID=UPI003850D500
MKSWNEQRQEWMSDAKAFLGFYSSPSEFINGYNSAIRKLFLSLILHNTVYLRHQDYLDCIELIGGENMLDLLKDDAIRVVYDVHDYTFSNRDNDNWQLETMIRLAPLKDIYKDESSICHENKKIQGELRTLTERYRLFFDVNPKDGTTDKYSSLIVREASMDVEQEAYALKFGFRPNAQFSLEKALNGLRICDVLTGYAMQKELGVETVIQDAFARDYIEQKILLTGQKDQSVECFETILSNKGVPDIYELLKGGIIDFQDVLKIRNSRQAELFRQWIKQKDYDEREVMIELLKPCRSNIQSRLVSFIVPTSLGLINPALGVIAAAGESFLLNMIADHWNPKLFLDESLASFLNEKIKQQEK